MQIRVNCKDIWFKPIFNRENIFKAVYLVSDNEIGFKIGHGKTPKPFKILDIRRFRDLTQFDPRHANLIISRPFDKTSIHFRNFNLNYSDFFKYFRLLSNISEYFELFRLCPIVYPISGYLKAETGTFDIFPVSWWIFRPDSGYTYEKRKCIY